MPKIGLGLKRFIKCALIFFFFHRIVLNFMVFFSNGYDLILWWQSYFNLLVQLIRLRVSY